MDLISQIVNNDLFIFISSISGILGLIISIIITNQVSKIKKYVDNSKEFHQNNTFGKNEAKIDA